jgi:hypothetical protein
MYLFHECLTNKKKQKNLTLIKITIKKQKQENQKYHESKNLSNQQIISWHTLAAYCFQMAAKITFNAYKIYISLPSHFYKIFANIFIHPTAKFIPAVSCACTLT